MSFLRPAEEADRSELENFTCADPALPFQVEVQEFVRHLLDWRADPAGIAREVVVFEDAGHIVGVVSYEDDEGDCFVNAAAIRSDRQGEGLGRLLLGSVLVDLQEHSSYEVATWLVHPANFASHAVSRALGAEDTYPPEDRPLARYVISLRP